jgi:hypothetical protein
MTRLTRFTVTTTTVWLLSAFMISPFPAYSAAFNKKGGNKPPAHNTQTAPKPLADSQSSKELTTKANGPSLEETMKWISEKLRSNYTSLYYDKKVLREVVLGGLCTLHLSTFDYSDASGIVFDLDFSNVDSVYLREGLLVVVPKSPVITLPNGSIENIGLIIGGDMANRMLKAMLHARDLCKAQEAF